MPVSPGETTRSRVEYIEDAQSEGRVDRKYRELLPSASLRWDLSDADRINLSLARTVKRPNFNELVPALLDGEFGDNDYIGIFDDVAQALAYAADPGGYTAPNWPLVSLDNAELRAAVEDRFDVVPLSDGLALRPKSRMPGVRLIATGADLAKLCRLIGREYEPEITVRKHEPEKAVRKQKSEITVRKQVIKEEIQTDELLSFDQAYRPRI